MCMLFIKPKNLTLPIQYLESLKEHNADGVSVYNLESSELFKTLDYNEAFDYLNGSHDKQLVVHFRFGTSGENTEDQLHGWEILKGEYLFFHNGMLSTFKGDKAKGLSDTQQFVNFVNTHDNFTLNDVIEYLEIFETNSRFLIVKKSDNSVITPKCAKWNSPIKINDASVQFSNTYAIDWHLLEDDGHLIERPMFNKYSNYNAKYSFSNMYDEFDDYENDDLESNLAEDDLLFELENLIYHHTYKDVVNFITVNPEITATYLKRNK